MRDFDTTLITCTGDRPEAFKLCEYYMSRQTRQAVKWIVVDDGVTPTECTMGQKVIRLPNEPDKAQSFRKNYTAGVEAVDTYKFLFIEDDDWYHPQHVELLSSCLGIGATRDCNKDVVYLAGQGRARYYNVQHRMWLVHGNLSHASLCQTGCCHERMQKLILYKLRESDHPHHLDTELWHYYNQETKVIDPKHKFIIPCSTTCVGIKGMPGRSGIGVGHASKPFLLQSGYTPDPEGDKAIEWMGFYDFRQYKDKHHE